MRFLASAFFLGAVTAASAFSGSYTITDLGDLGGGISGAAAINNAGQIVGSSTVAGGATRAFLYANGAMIDLGTLGGSNSTATAINDLGQIAGTSDDFGSLTRSVFLTTDGAMKSIGLTVLSSGGFVTASGIDNKGEVAAYRGLDGGDGTLYRGYLYSGGTLRDLTSSGLSLAVDIDSRGRVLGYAFTSGGIRTVLYDHGKVTPIARLNTSHLIPTSLNSSGEIAGAPGSGRWPFFYAGGQLFVRNTTPGSISDLNDAGIAVGSIRTGGTEQAVVYLGKQRYPLAPMVTLPSPPVPPVLPDWQLTAATGINDQGEIVGYGISPQGKSHAFLLQPASPSLVVLGNPLVGSRTTHAANLTIRGWAFGPGVSVVSYRIGHSPYKRALGTSRWRFVAKLRPGLNKIFVAAGPSLGNGDRTQFFIYRR